MMAICLTGISGEVRADGLYNAREELEYTPQAKMDRLEEQNRQIQFQRYQQQQYMERERLMNQESMYNLVHESLKGDAAGLREARR